jgi:hypothetical protein
MRQLLYVSNTSRDVADSVLDDILASSRKNNLKAGITGVLLYIDGGFMKVLEGERRAVTETYARICKDQRHWNMGVLLTVMRLGHLVNGAWDFYDHHARRIMMGCSRSPGTP